MCGEQLIITQAWGGLGYIQALLRTSLTYTHVRHQKHHVRHSVCSPSALRFARLYPSSALLGFSHHPAAPLPSSTLPHWRAPDFSTCRRTGSTFSIFALLYFIPGEENPVDFREAKSGINRCGNFTGERMPIRKNWFYFSFAFPFGTTLTQTAEILPLWLKVGRLHLHHQANEPLLLLLPLLKHQYQQFAQQKNKHKYIPMLSLSYGEMCCVFVAINTRDHIAAAVVLLSCDWTFEIQSSLTNKWYWLRIGARKQFSVDERENVTQPVEQR